MSLIESFFIGCLVAMMATLAVGMVVGTVWALTGRLDNPEPRTVTVTVPTSAVGGLGDAAGRPGTSGGTP